jgi:hypothetical protein
VLCFDWCCFGYDLCTDPGILIDKQELARPWQQSNSFRAIVSLMSLLVFLGVLATCAFVAGHGECGVLADHSTCIPAASQARPREIGVVSFYVLAVWKYEFDPRSDF